ncbi:MAG: ribonuclease catalytic domain-containing protein [Syntrophobacteraceae bacterium]
MTQVASHEITPGTVLELFEAKKIVCGVCTAVKSQRLAVLTEQNKEANLGQSRVLHFGGQPLSLALGRDELVRRLQEVSALRKSLMKQVNVEELWSLVESEEDGFETRDLAEMIFSEDVGGDHVAAVQRVLLEDRVYFDFKDGLFHARSQEKVEQRRVELSREEERETQLGEGAKWLHVVWQRKTSPPPFGGKDRLVDALRSFALFGQESPDYAFTKELFKRAGIPHLFISAFRLLVRLGVWREDENIFLHQQGVSVEFPEDVLRLTEGRAASAPELTKNIGGRRDLRELHVFTIDSQLTRDYDDALSFRTLDDGLYEVGVHIADAAEFVQSGDFLDEEAMERGSTIYLPDGRVPMLPARLSEDACSLRSGVDRLTMSFLIRMDAEGCVRSYEIVPSVVNIAENMTYEQVDKQLESQEFLSGLHRLGARLRERRLAQGAIILPLPEIHVYVNPEGMIQLSRHVKETPSQIIVSEWMIAINGLAGAFLSEHGVPAIFRSQTECKPETEPVASEHEIFHVYRRRRLFARAELGTEARTHCSLGVSAYTSISSPIRRYVDLVVQRQLKHFLETGSFLYSEDGLRKVIDLIGVSQSKVFFIQRKWTRYWTLKYMEQEYIHSLDALVLNQNERFAHLLLPDFLMEVNMPLTGGARLQPGEMLRVKVERVNPREEILRVHL